MNTLKDKKGFLKLFDIKIPRECDFDYYIDQLSNLSRYSNIKELVDIYHEDELKYGDLFELRMILSNEIINELKNTHAYNEMLIDQLSGLPTNKSYSYDNGIYVSIDLRSANFQSLKKYDQRGEIPTSYSELLSNFNSPEIFKHSKYLRQVIFGNLNPKRQQLVQRHIVQELVRKLDSENIQAVRNDEIIIKLESYDEYESNIEPYVDFEKYRVKIFQNSNYDGFRIEREIDSDGRLISKDFYGLNRNMLFWKIKELITFEEIEDRDLYFISEGKLAKWVIE